MPVFNSEQYLKETLESVLNQKFNDWELLCVDDGSSDNSLNILNFYKQLDSRIKVIESEHSGSASGARNKALPFVNGDYIAMLDSDDKYEKDTLQLLVEKINETGADFIVFCLNFCDAKCKKVISKICGLRNSFTDIISGQEAFIESLDWNIAGCGAIRSDIVKKIKYNENGMNGDELSTRLFFLESHSVAFTKAKYLYRSNYNSSTKKISEKYFYTLDTILALIKIINDYNLLSNILETQKKKYFNSIMSNKIALNLNKENLSKEEYNRVLHYLKHHYILNKNIILTSHRTSFNLKNILINLLKSNWFIFNVYTYFKSILK